MKFAEYGMNMPVVKGMGDGNYILNETWNGDVEISGEEYRIEIKSGLVFDGASVPRLLWPICGSPMETPRYVAGMVHDAMYAAQVTSRKFADKTYRGILNGLGQKYRASVEYAALRIFGGLAWGRVTEEEREKTRNILSVKSILTYTAYRKED